MIRQINYIIYAVLILSTVGAALQIIKRIPSVVIVEKKNDFFCGTENQHSQNFSATAVQGKALFMSKCASCHSIYKDGTGPALVGLEDRGLWADQDKLHEWIKDPVGFIKKDFYTQSLKKKYGSVMTAFPEITKEEVAAIVQYINESNGNRLPVP